MFLIREPGRGGMSYVFLAARVDGGHTHEVALKLLRPGIDTELDQARFRAERQILASLNHANIARLLDGGATDDGLPYMVIEHIDGTPINAYADEHGLGIRERVTLFRTVCRSTEYAHRNLVVHRDLKPSNIFVDRAGVVRLLNFGLAKMLEPGGYPGRAGTHTARRWMTPGATAARGSREVPRDREWPLERAPAPSLLLPGRVQTGNATPNGLSGAARVNGWSAKAEGTGLEPVSAFLRGGFQVRRGALQAFRRCCVPLAQGRASVRLIRPNCTGLAPDVVRSVVSLSALPGLTDRNGQQAQWDGHVTAAP